MAIVTVTGLRSLPAPPKLTDAKIDKWLNKIGF